MMPSSALAFGLVFFVYSGASPYFFLRIWTSCKWACMQTGRQLINRSLGRLNGMDALVASHGGPGRAMARLTLYAGYFS